MKKIKEELFLLELSCNVVTTAMLRRK